MKNTQSIIERAEELARQSHVLDICAERILLVIDAMEAEEKRRASMEARAEALAGERWDGLS